MAILSTWKKSAKAAIVSLWNAGDHHKSSHKSHLFWKKTFLNVTFYSSTWNFLFNSNVKQTSVDLWESQSSMLSGQFLYSSWQYSFILSSSKLLIKANNSSNLFNTKLLFFQSVLSHKCEDNVLAMKRYCWCWTLNNKSINNSHPLKNLKPICYWWRNKFNCVPILKASVLKTYFTFMSRMTIKTLQ